MSEGKIIARRREDRPEVLYLVISNPKALNALTEEMQIDLIEKLRAARDDKSVRCVVLRGEGDRAFSSGGEVQSLEKLTDPAACEAMYQRGCDIRETIETYDKPIIAAVSGYCVGGGFEIAMCCDMLYASDDARFSLPESKLGLVPGWGGAIRLPRKLTVNRAKEMILLRGADDCPRGLSVRHRQQGVPQSPYFRGRGFHRGPAAVGGSPSYPGGEGHRVPRHRGRQH